MIYRIFEQDAETLLDKPETGMGYQIINASQYERYQNRKFVVYNTNLAIELDSDFQINKRLVIKEGYRAILNQVKELMLETSSIRVLDNSSVREFKILSESKKSFYNRNVGGKGAIDNPKEFANGLDLYIRISAYEDDKRIDYQKKKLMPGSFTTTLADYTICIHTNDDPIDRYALPNEETIKWSFYIRPESTDVLQKGIVQPAFNKEGGGIEAYFENGTSAETFLFRRDYGK